jgi:hypothetical protein
MTSTGSERGLSPRGAGFAGPLPMIWDRPKCSARLFFEDCEMTTADKAMDFWIYDGAPSEPGWYAVLVCYDSEEGAFPQGAYWDGYAWSWAAVVAFGESRATKQLAKELAYEHDPDAPMKEQDK